MEKVTFVVDSGSDYESYLATYLQYPVKVIPLHLLIDGVQYLDGVNITKSTFYKEMENSEVLPKTSQPTPHDFYEVFANELRQGNKILYLSISSKLSGTYQSADIAKRIFSEEDQQNIFLVDSKSVSAIVIFMLIKANECLEKDFTLEETVKELEIYRDKLSLIAFLDTLENLKKGGRISLTQATIGEFLKIKPLITIEDGVVITLEKFRGRKKGLKFVSEYINNEKNDIDKSKIFFVHSYTSEERLKEEVNEIDLSSFKEVIYLKLGTTVGTHAGANTLGLVFQKH